MNSEYSLKNREEILQILILESLQYSARNNEKFYPHKMFAASEGTLGFVTSAKLKIIDVLLYRATIVFGFKDILSSISAVPLVLQFSLLFWKCFIILCFVILMLRPIQES